MVTYEVDPAVLGPFVPAGTELDLWRGKSLASVVGFRFSGTRIMGVPTPLYGDFSEVNLRFYVKRAFGGDIRRGVVFVKEIVPHHMVALVANLVYQERFDVMPVQLSDYGHHITYAWRQDMDAHRLSLSLEDIDLLPHSGTLEHFITERYWGYNRRDDGVTLEFRVDHRPWRVTRATQHELACDVGKLYGRQFAPFLRGEPAAAFVVDGSRVAVQRPQALMPLTQRATLPGRGPMPST